jgi:serpin B
MEKRGWKRTMLCTLAALVLVSVASGLAGCVGPAPAGRVVQADAIQSERPRLPAESLDAAKVPELIEGNTEFALDLYGVLFDGEENLFFSPHSLSLALAMAYAGAGGQTEQQMAEALHYTLPQAELHPAFNALAQTLDSRGGREDREVFLLHLANAVWGQEGDSFLDAFLDTLAEYYGAGLQTVDFEQSEEARQVINRWASEQTEDRIRELLPQGAVDGETALVLANAACFQAAWQYPFREEDTHEGVFTLPDGSQVTVPMMAQVASLGYTEHAGVQAVELPYAGGMSMVILLPQAGTFETFVKGLDVQELDAILGNLEPTDMQLAMPRFGFNTEFALQEALMALGMVDAFGDANFSGIDDTYELFIDEVYHEAFVAVDEAGTEATAASAVMIVKKGSIVEQEVRIDRPFLFLIRDVETGAVLFLGHLANPVPASSLP